MVKIRLNDDELSVVEGFASQRTKNRLREHTLIPVRVAHVKCFGKNDTEAVYAICTCHDEPWAGWFPRHEVAW